MNTLQSYLPSYTTTFVGRSQDAQAIRTLFDSQQRCITIYGPSGTGKTRLAVEVARQSERLFPQGILFIPLAPIHDPLLVLPTLALHLNIHEQAGVPLIDLLVQALLNQRVLLIFDNMEQVLAAGQELVQLIRRVPTLTILVTSQAPLAVPEEQLVQIPPLHVPHISRRTQPADLLEYPAIALFVERIRAIQPEFTLHRANMAMVAETCARLCGLPLAIEIIAAHSRYIAVTDLLFLLRNYLPPIDTKYPSLERQKILHPLLHWCVNVLSESTKLLFTLLGTFIGGVTHPMLLKISQPFLADQRSVNADVQLLTLKHLLLIEQADTPRYHMVDAVWDFARELLIQHPNGSMMFQHHMQLFLNLVEDAEHHLRGPDQPLWLATIKHELPNIRAAFNWALDTGRYEDAGKIAGAMARFWYFGGMFSEGQAWYEALQPQIERISPSIQAKLWYGQGLLAWAMDFYNQANLAYERSLMLYRQEGNQVQEAAVLNNLGIVANNNGDRDLAEQYYTQCFEMYRKLDNPRGIAGALNNLGIIASTKGDLLNAVYYYQTALKNFRTLGDRRAQANALHNLAHLAYLQQDYQQATLYINQSLSVWETLESTEIKFFCNTLSLRIRIQFASQETIETEADLRQCLQLCRQIQSPTMFIEVLILSLLWINQHHAATLKIASLAHAIQHLRQHYPIRHEALDDWTPLLTQALEKIQLQLDSKTWKLAQQNGAIWSLDQAIEFAHSYVFANITIHA